MRNRKATTKQLGARIKKKTLSVYAIKDEEKTQITSKKKEKERDSYVYIYECGKLFCTPTFKYACSEQVKIISHTK